MQDVSTLASMGCVIFWHAPGMPCLNYLERLVFVNPANVSQSQNCLREKSLSSEFPLFAVLTCILVLAKKK